MSGRDDSHVDTDRPRASEPRDLLVLQHSKQLDLEIGRQIADFVEENCRAVSQFEESNLFGQRAREGALFAAEQLAFDERLRNGRAVDFHHRSPSPRTEMMHLRGEELLAAASFAEQQHRGISSRHLTDLLEDPAEHRAPTREAFELRPLAGWRSILFDRPRCEADVTKRESNEIGIELLFRSFERLRIFSRNGQRATGSLHGSLPERCLA